MDYQTKLVALTCGECLELEWPCELCPLFVDCHRHLTDEEIEGRAFELLERWAQELKEK